MKNIIRIISILLLANAFFPILMENLPSPLNSTFFWIAAWVGAITLFEFKIMLRKEFIIIFFTFFVFFFFKRYHFNSSYASRYLVDIRDIFVAASVYLYFIKSKDYQGLKYLITACLIFTVISSFTSIIGFELHPYAIRFNIKGALSSSEYSREKLFFHKIGIMDYDFFYGMAFAVPVLIYKLKTLFKTHKFIAVLFFSVGFFAIVKSTYAVAFLFAMSGTILSLIEIKNFKKYRIMIIVFALLLFLIPGKYYATGFNQITKLIPGTSILHNRITDLSLTLEGYDDTHCQYRLDRIPFLLNEIKKNNQFLGGGESTGHVYWLDLLSLFGIIGFVPFIMIFIYLIKFNSKILPDHFKYYYYLSMSLFFINGLVKNSGGDLVFFFIFLIVPGIGIIENKTISNTKLSINEVTYV